MDRAAITGSTGSTLRERSAARPRGGDGARIRLSRIGLALVVGVLVPLGIRPDSTRAEEPASSCTSNTLPPNDDGSSEAVELGFTIDFFGTEYTSVYVNNNGNITFSGPLVEYTPTPIVGAGTPIIAPFWADVDTRAAGSAVVTYGQTVVGDRLALCIAWDGVGYFSAHDDKLNEFQLLLIDRSDVAAGDFDIVFSYSQVLWETGDASGGSGGVGGSSARAGYSNGQSSTADTSYELPGSAINGGLLDSNAETGLVNNSANTSDPGMYVFPVRNGEPPPPPMHTLDVTLAGDGSGSVTSDPAGIDCPETCSADFVDGTTVALSATADEGSSFTGWSGDCEGEACSVTMTEARGVTATFEADEPAGADLSVSQTDDPDPVTAGNSVEYLITVANAGPDTATGVTLTSSLPEGTSMVSADSPDCSTEGGVVTCLLGTLASEESVEVAIVVDAPMTSTPTTLTNSASVTADQADPNPDNNASIEETSVQVAVSERDVAAGFVDDGGGTVATGAGQKATKQDPTTTAVTVPPGFPGVVTIVEGPITTCPTGFRCFGQEAFVTAPTTQADEPLRLVFNFHPSSKPSMTKLKDIVMFHDNVLVPRCTQGGGVAVPDPCISSVKRAKGQLTIVVFSSTNGSWRGGR